jgi:dTMP kinase
MQRGRFITIEGGEGVGKSTQIDAVRTQLAQASIDVVLTREPGGTERAEKIRELLLTPSDEPMPQMCELLLMFAARATHIENVIKPALSRGAWVICDRFTDASYAYQGGGRGMSTVTIAALENMVQGELRPDLTLLLDAPIELAMARARQRNAELGNASGDRFEREQSEFFQRVRAAYLRIAQADPKRVKVIDASHALAQVEQAVRASIDTFIHEARA